VSYFKILFWIQSQACEETDEIIGGNNLLSAQEKLGHVFNENNFNALTTNVQYTGSFRKSFTHLKDCMNLFRGLVQYFNCHNVGKRTEFILEWLRFNLTSTSTAGCLKKPFTVVFQMLLCGECYENVYT
jgi:hypothetical protein